MKLKKKINEGIPQLAIKKYALSNGLRILLIPNDKLPTFSIYIHYGVGAKHEVAGITGSSHFLEHMMFKGAKDFGKGSFDRLIEGNGGVSNAYTSNDATVYHENLPIDALEITLKMEADRMQNLLLDPQEFLAEKDVVLEERKLRYENSPKGQLFIRTMTTMYEGTPYGSPVIGSIEDIKRVSRDEVFEYFKKYYAPNNAVMVIAGDISESKTLKLIESTFGVIPESAEVQAAKSVRENPDLYKTTFKQDKLELLYGQSENPLFMLAIPAYPYGSREGYALDILGKIFGDGRSSYLEQKYVKSISPILVNVSAGNYSKQHSGMFYIMGEFYKNTSFGWWKKELQSDFDKFCENEITPKNLAKAVNAAEKNYYENLDQNSGAADNIGTMELFFGDFKKYVEELKVYRTLTVEELKVECVKLSKKPKYLLGIWKKFDKKIKL
jgi:zinc protease